MRYEFERSENGRWILHGVSQRGSAVLMDPLLNQGTAFDAEDRARLGLEGMLPTGVTTREQQVRRAYEHIGAKGDNPLEKYVGMMSLLDRNETLFYQVLAGHIAELIPIVYTPTVGEAAVRFSHVFRRGRGVWITPEHRGRIHEILGHVRNDSIRLIVATDNERILGLGDQGAGGMVIPMGKLALYTLGAGIHPAFTLPVSLDVGTDNTALLDDELYVGWRGARLRGDQYESLVAEFVDAVRRRWPGALLQWEDFKKANAFNLLDRYRETLPSFNDDIQGTAAVVAAGVHSYCRATGASLADQRFVLAGAGAAGVGIARLLLHEIESLGVGGADLCRRVVLVDSSGVVTNDRDDIEDYKRTVACPADLLGDMVDPGSGDLVTLIKRLRPTVLIGTTGQRDVFGPDVLAALAAQVERPLVMALSNPSSKSEAYAIGRGGCHRRPRVHSHRQPVRAGLLRRSPHSREPVQQRVHLPGRRVGGDRGEVPRGLRRDVRSGCLRAGLDGARRRSGRRAPVSTARRPARHHAAYRAGRWRERRSPVATRPSVQRRSSRHSSARSGTSRTQSSDPSDRPAHDRQRTAGCGHDRGNHPTPASVSPGKTVTCGLTAGMLYWREVDSGG